jgi:hypothetical protein
VDAAWKVSFPLKRESDYGFFEYACPEGNYAMRNPVRGRAPYAKAVIAARRLAAWAVGLGA